MRDISHDRAVSTALAPAKNKGREITLHKAVVAPLLGERNVLTNSPWMYVRLWLTRERNKDALFYWDQANEFQKAASGLPIESAPLLLYYSFMNATKALLSAKGIAFNPYHGIKERKVAAGAVKKKVILANTAVTIQNQGVLPSLSDYFNEAEASKDHSLKDMLFNLAFIHRTYCLSYTAQSEMFIPLVDPMYVHDKANNQVYFSATVSKNLTPTKLKHQLPSTFVIDSSVGPMSIRSANTAPWPQTGAPKKAEVDGLAQLHRQLRNDLQYINGPLTLWYVKGNVKGAARLQRQSTTLAIAIMHRLSELSRYKPFDLQSLLAGQTNWLLTEFINMSPAQFIDEIASEITGNQFLIPNVRSPT